MVILGEGCPGKFFRKGLAEKGATGGGWGSGWEGMSGGSGALGCSGLGAVGN